MNGVDSVPKEMVSALSAERWLQHHQQLLGISAILRKSLITDVFPDAIQLSAFITQTSPDTFFDFSISPSSDFSEGVPWWRMAPPRKAQPKCRDHSEAEAGEKNNSVYCYFRRGLREGSTEC